MSKHYTDSIADNYIQGNVYAITGGGSGFGQGTAIEIVKMGGKVAIMGRTAEKLQATVDSIKELGLEDSVLAFAGDVSKYEDNVAFVKAAVEKFGKLDAFFANAGIMPNAPLKEHKIALEHWDKCIDINMKGNLYGICASYDQFKAQGYGHFLTTSSIHGNFPTAGAGVYAATKIAVRYMAHSLAVENSGCIKTTVINPPGVMTTGLFSTVVCSGENDGIMGANGPKFMADMQGLMSGQAPELADINNANYTAVNTDDMVRSIMYALNQPKGISISEVTMYSGNNPFIL